MGTKARLKFLNRAARFDGDIEFVDVIYSAVLHGDLTPPADHPLFLHVEAATHPRLSTQKISEGNRNHVAGHLRKSVYASYVKDLYEDFSEYLAEIVNVARKGFTPRRIAAGHKVTLDANEILDCGSWEGVLDLVTESVFDRLGSMSNTQRITQLLDDVLGLNLDEAIVSAAQPYVELRHLLVHADGVATPEFCSNFPGFRAYENETVKLTSSTVREARAAVTALVEHIDARAIAAGLVVADDMQ